MLHIGKLIETWKAEELFWLEENKRLADRVVELESEIERLKFDLYLVRQEDVRRRGGDAHDRQNQTR